MQLKISLGVTALCLSQLGYGFENLIGLDATAVHTDGSSCRQLGDECQTASEQFRLYYGARFTEQLELRISWGQLNVKLTDEVDDIYNSAEVTSYMTSLGGLYFWQINELMRLGMIGGMAYYEEILPGDLFYNSGTNSGLTPFGGLDLEVGKSLLRFGLSAECYPIAGDGALTVLSAGIRFVW